METPRYMAGYVNLRRKEITAKFPSDRRLLVGLAQAINEKLKRHEFSQKSNMAGKAGTKRCSAVHGWTKT